MTLFLAACAAPAEESSEEDAPADNEEAAADEEPAADGEVVTIEWWVPNWDEESATTLVEEFEAENSDIEVELVITTWDTMENQIRTALSNNNPPQVITELESRIPRLAEQELLAEIDPFLEDSSITKDDIVTSALDMNTVGDALYGLPFRHDGNGVYYNVGMFEEAGLDGENFPATYAELLEASEALTQDTDGDGTIDQYATAYPFGNQANAVTHFVRLVYTNGGTILNEDGTEATLDTPEAIAAMSDIAILFDEGFATISSTELDNTTLRGLFVNEQIAYYVSGPYDVDPIQEENPDIELGTAVIPGPDGMGTTTANGFSLIIPAGAENQDAAWQFVEFVAEPENMGRLTATFPGRKSAYELERFSDPLLQPFAEQLEQGQSEPAFSEWPLMEEVIFEYIQLVVLGEISPEDAMVEVDAAIDEIVAE